MSKPEFGDLEQQNPRDFWPTRQQTSRRGSPGPKNKAWRRFRAITPDSIVAGGADSISRGPKESRRPAWFL